MSQSVLYPIADAEQLVHDFQSGKLPASEFSHEAHLVTGLHMLAHHGDESLPLLRQMLMDFLAANGVPNTDTSGYHETMTRFWLWVLQTAFAPKGQAEGENGQVPWNQEVLDELVASEILTERNLWLRHYSKERMMSVEARRGFVEPDLEPLDRVV